MHDDHSQDPALADETPPAPAGKRLRFWLLGAVAALLLLLLAGLLLSGFYLSSPAVINKIQQAVAEQAGFKMEFQSIELDYFPQPAVVLQQVNLAMPDYGQGKVAEISLSPAILPLLLGDLRLARLRLEQPEFSLDLPAVKTQERPAASGGDAGLQKRLAKGFAMLGKVSPDFVLTINRGRLTAGRDMAWIETGGLDLRLALSVTDPTTASATLRGTAAELKVRRHGHLETLKNAELNGSIALDGEMTRLDIKRLALDEPGLQLSGTLEQASGTSSVAMELSGGDIDVDATRQVALALAGDIDLVGEIFKYLRGGTVAQITLRTRGGSAEELGELKNLRIEGKLRDGAVSIPEIELDLTETVGNVLIVDGILQGSGISTRLEGSSGHDGSFKIGLAEGIDLFQLELMLNADLARARQIVRRIVDNPEFIAELDRVAGLEGTGTGKLTLGDSLENLYAEVDVADLNFSAAYDRVPFPIKVNAGQVTFAENLVSVKGWQGTLGDSKFSELSCQVDLAGGGLARGESNLVLRFDGTLEEDLIKWLSETFAVPQSYAIRSPVKLSAAELDWQEAGKTKFKGGLAVQGGPDLALDLAWQPGQLEIHNLKLKDQYSDAELSLDYGTRGTDLSFNGTLQHDSLDALFVAREFGAGQVAGDFAVRLPGRDKAGASATGQLQGANLSFALPSGEPLAVEQATLSADGDQVDVELSRVAWRDLIWDPITARLDLSGDLPMVRVAQANLCGLNAPGVWTIDDNKLALDVTLDGKSLDLTTLSRCVEREQVKMTGTLDLSGQVSGQGRIDGLLEALQGPVQAKFSNGTIRQGKILARTLEVLNVTEIVKGRLPSLSSTAFAYKTITLQGEFRAGKLLISKIEMDGETLDILGQGEVDLLQQTVAVELLAAPFQTVDTVVKMIPGVNYLMAGSLVAIPVSIKGPLGDPQVQVLSASSVGSSLLRLGERTIKSPLKLIEQFTPQRNGQNK